MDLQRPDWGGPWSDKSLVALQEVSVVFTAVESPPSPNGSKSSVRDSCWVTGFVSFFPLVIEIFERVLIFTA